MSKDGRLPGWFRALFVATMLIVCGVIAFCAVEQVQLRFQVADLTLSLDTSRQRERKQQYEYDQVVADLPATQQKLNATAPLAELAVASVTDLKAQRSALRERRDAFTEELAAARQAAADAQALRDALQADVDALTLRASELEAQLAALTAP